MLMNAAVEKVGFILQLSRTDVFTNAVCTFDRRFKISLRLNLESFCNALLVNEPC